MPIFRRLFSHSIHEDAVLKWPDFQVRRKDQRKMGFSP